MLRRTLPASSSNFTLGILGGVALVLVASLAVITIPFPEADVPKPVIVPDVSGAFLADRLPLLPLLAICILIGIGSFGGILTLRRQRRPTRDWLRAVANESMAMPDYATPAGAFAEEDGYVGKIRFHRRRRPLFGRLFAFNLFLGGLILGAMAYLGSFGRGDGAGVIAVAPSSPTDILTLIGVVVGLSLVLTFIGQRFSDLVAAREERGLDLLERVMLAEASEEAARWNQIPRAVRPEGVPRWRLLLSALLRAPLVILRFPFSIPGRIRYARMVREAERAAARARLAAAALEVADAPLAAAPVTSAAPVVVRRLPTLPALPRIDPRSAATAMLILAMVGGGVFFANAARDSLLGTGGASTPPGGSPNPVVSPTPPPSPSPTGSPDGSPSPSPTASATPAPSATPTPTPNSAAARRAALPPCPGASDCGLYTVRAGDYLIAIARRFDVTYAALLRANPEIRNPSLIITGQEIRIPR